MIVTVALVVGVGVGVGATIFFTRGGEDAAVKPWVPPAADSPLKGSSAYLDEGGIQKYCLDRGGKQTVIAYFDGGDPDSVMRRAAKTLAGDEQVTWVQTETRQQAYQRFRRIFAQQPDLLELVRPEALPASVTLLPADGVYPGDLAKAITGELPEIDSVSAGCELPK